MNGKMMLYIDQYGNKYNARTRKELRSLVENGGSRISKMFVDTKKGNTVHIGYVIGRHWLTAYEPMRRPA